MRYALITGLLTVAYVGLVLLATQAFAFHTPVAVAASTLTAVLFNLPRRRLQRAALPVVAQTGLVLASPAPAGPGPDAFGVG
jgi:hypothetical protein